MCKIVSLLMLLFLGICSFCDCKSKQIPMVYLMLMSGIALGTLFCSEGVVLSKLLGAFVGVLFLAVSKVTKEIIGYGDSWTILNLGIWLGGYRLMQVLFWGGFAAGLYGVFVLWFKKWKRNETIPFVPFLTLGCVGVLLT